MLYAADELPPVAQLADHYPGDPDPALFYDPRPPTPSTVTTSSMMSSISTGSVSTTIPTSTTSHFNPTPRRGPGAGPPTPPLGRTRHSRIVSSGEAERPRPAPLADELDWGRRARSRRPPRALVSRGQGPRVSVDRAAAGPHGVEGGRPARWGGVTTRAVMSDQPGGEAEVAGYQLKRGTGHRVASQPWMALVGKQRVGEGAAEQPVRGEHPVDLVEHLQGAHQVVDRHTAGGVGQRPSSAKGSRGCRLRSVTTAPTAALVGCQFDRVPAQGDQGRRGRSAKWEIPRSS